MSKGQRYNPGWPSAQADSPAARAKRKAAQRQRDSEFLATVDAKLQPLGLNHKSLLQGVADGTLRVYVVAAEVPQKSGVISE